MFGCLTSWERWKGTLTGTFFFSYPFFPGPSLLVLCTSWFDSNYLSPPVIRYQLFFPALYQFRFFFLFFSFFLSLIFTG
ncbi:hypothetical protein B9Z19DRAFT_1093289 [Tuber borchii]|uniref:Uncharacterized protein n=1 Tax=Tuber borchii TaxID=42251 RepID=A0A2T6ZFK6_TUBBO|nr:hypothetical protein B9Z19DRAFT_1093289 [Tuber borchii]